MSDDDVEIPRLTLGEETAPPSEAEYLTGRLQDATQAAANALAVYKGHDKALVAAMKEVRKAEAALAAIKEEQWQAHLKLMEAQMRVDLLKERLAEVTGEPS